MPKLCQFVWANVFDLPQIHQLKPGAAFEEAVSEEGKLRRGRAGREDSPISGPSF